MVEGALIVVIFHGVQALIDGSARSLALGFCCLLVHLHLIERRLLFCCSLLLIGHVVEGAKQLLCLRVQVSRFAVLILRGLFLCLHDEVLGRLLACAKVCRRFRYSCVSHILEQYGLFARLRLVRLLWRVLRI